MPGEQEPRQRIEGNFNAQAFGDSIAVVNMFTYEWYASSSPLDNETVSRARQRLEELPVDEVPDIGTLPVGSTMPFGSNPIFVGREEELKIIAANLKAGGTTAICTATGQISTTATTGLGGIGKTQLANEFVHRYGQYFEGGVYWLNFADPSNIRAEIASCGEPGRMDLWPPIFDNMFDHLPIEQKQRKVLQEKERLVNSAWQNSLPRLLVFDGCEDPQLLDQWRPSTGGCAVLVTSLRQRWDANLGVRSVELDVLKREESITLLRHHRSDLSAEDPDLNSIAEELDDLPFTLDLAGRYLAESCHEVTPGEYLMQLRSSERPGHHSVQRARGNPR